MESMTTKLRDLTKIPEKEFKEHFRDWMEQNDIARSLQAKLRKDLISSFNKTSLGKKIIAQADVSHRLTLSPLILALNTLVAEFLYAQNCHFTLSVFCTEVPYRNTLPDFEGERHFRFSEHEIFEIFDALCSKWTKQTKVKISKEYAKEHNYSLLLIVLRNLLNKPTESEIEEVPVPLQEIPQPKPQNPKKPEAKLEYQSNNFRYLNKYLIILSKKVKEMSLNLEQLQKQKNTPQAARKSVQTRKFENLNRSLEKISENLRQMSVSKKKHKRLAAVVTAVETMAKQFEKCATNFDQVSKEFVIASTSGTALTEKSYNDWVRELRTTNNGKIFLEKIETSLRKTLHRERDKMERELEQRLQIQKDITKTKYKQKLMEELAKYTSRGKSENAQKTNESFEVKLKEFEAKHQELHQRIHEAERKVMETPIPIVESIPKQPELKMDNRGTQTISETKPEPVKIKKDTQHQLQQMVKTFSEQERQVDHIVFDAKLRIQELEHESNQLDCSFRDYLERQRTEKKKMRETATSIWQSYALGKSMLDKKCATLRSTAATIGNHSVISTPVLVDSSAIAIPTINIDVSASASPPAFENPFRIAQRKILARSKTLPPPPPPSKDTDSRAEKYTRHQSQQQRPSVFRLIEHNDESRSEVEQMSLPPPLSPSRVPTKVTAVKQLSPELNIKDITLDGIEISPTTAMSSSPRSGESNGSTSSPRGVFKLRRQLFTATDNGGPSTSNGNKEAEEPLKQINKENSDDGKKCIDGDRKNIYVNRKMKGNGIGTSKVRTEGPRGIKLDAPSIVAEEDVSSQSSRLNISTDGARAEK